MDNHDLKEALDLFEVKPGKFVPMRWLRTVLVDIETTLFFAKLLKLDYSQLSYLLRKRWPHIPVIEALQAGDHSYELQDYIVDSVPVDVVEMMTFTAKPDEMPDSVLLAQLWEHAATELLSSLEEVGDKLALVLDKLPSKQGTMLFQTLAKLSRVRPTLGVHQASIHHQRVPDVLVIFDTSGSMGESTVGTVAQDVVAMSWKANATLAVVSNTTKRWQPGSFSTQDVLDAAEYGGTQYETLAPLLNKDWSVVICIADYDSSWSAKDQLAKCTGRIGTVLDVSLVGRPTYLAECVGQLADEVRPILIARNVI